jgi:hypothetical protein
MMRAGFEVREQRCAVVFANAWLLELRMASLIGEMFEWRIQHHFWLVGFLVSCITL